MTTASVGQRRRTLLRRAWRRRLLCVLSLTAVVVGVAMVLRSSMFTLRSVQVVGVHRIRAEAVRAAAQLPTGRNIFSADLAAAQRRVASLPAIATVSVRRALPSGVVIVVSERRPVLALPVGGGPVVLIDADGVQIGTAPAAPRGVPVLRLAPRPEGGWEPAVLAGVATVFRTLAPSVRDDIASATAASADDLVFVLRDGAVVRWGGAQRSADKAAVLSALRRRAVVSVEGLPRAPREYDLRAPDHPATR